MHIRDILFYFYICFGETQYPLAMVSLFSLPDQGVLMDSSGTVYLCEPLSTSVGLVVVPVKLILSVVSMFPEMQIDMDGSITETGKFSLMRQAFLELTQFSDTQSSGEDESTDGASLEGQTDVTEPI